jgi:hypothetical protein
MEKYNLYTRKILWQIIKVDLGHVSTYVQYIIYVRHILSNHVLY